MASRASGYQCGQCGWTTPKWAGRCGSCQSWGTVEAMGPPLTTGRLGVSAPRPAAPIGEIDPRRAVPIPTGVAEFDRVLGGGLVPGSVVLVAGEPGIGKSTLLLDVAARTAAPDRPVLYVSGEESASQVRSRAERIGAVREGLFLATDTELAVLLGHIEQLRPALVVVDSVQTIGSDDVEGAVGGVTQVRQVSAALARAAKTAETTLVLVGHVTKDGSIAGPRVLEHLVDVVVSFEGERHARLRLLRATKNRFGATDEVGCFEMIDGGLAGVSDPSGLFLSPPGAAVSGRCVCVTLEGRRPLVAEVQALVAADRASSPRRVSTGVDGSRLAMMLAVLERRARLPVGGSDVYAATVGGVRLTEPAADLAVALALASSALDRAIPRQTLAVGEVGLAGEIRPVPGVPRRLSEAARLGFDTGYVPAGSLGSSAPPEGMRVIEVGHLSEALRHAVHGHLSAAATPA